MTEATAPGKVILFGEHAVVYGRPAIAAPLSQVRAVCHIADSPHIGVRFIAPDLKQDVWLTDAPSDDPLVTAVSLVKKAANLTSLPNLTLTVRSQIPIASGLGSGAAIAAAVIRALAGHLGLLHLQSDAQVCALTYEVEKIHHGTPSGIDNTVVAYERPIYFMRQSPQNKIEPFDVAAPLRFLVADTGVRSSTKAVVEDVRRQWQADPATFNRIFAQCGRLAQAARSAIEMGNVAQVGALMTENHGWLQKMTVSSPQLDRLVTAALQAGALGAKLSGAGRGGNMIALVMGDVEKTAVRTALQQAGATSILTTVLTSLESINGKLCRYSWHVK
ncbi:MAG: mevalonate kinase [Chloroflexi bacterium]|nr:mevalonate kinase [Chloroflexota bacterium]